MSSNGGASTSPHVMSVLQTLYVDPDPIAKKRAGEWLEEFQHSVSPSPGARAPTNPACKRD
jgi:hypothetical protein